jgi:hypothetical protein
MNATENLFLQAIDLKLSQLIIDINNKEKDEQKEKLLRELPEWVNLPLAVEKKGAAAFDTYKTHYWLQPCCGLRSKKVGGRKSWHRDDIIEWLQITDDKLWGYAQKMGASIPPKYRIGTVN